MIDEEVAKDDHDDGGGRKTEKLTFIQVFSSLSIFDRLLPIFIILSIVTGILIGAYHSHSVSQAFSGAELHSVSIPILAGLLAMMVPPLTRVKWEALPGIFKQKQIWRNMALSIFLNVIVAPFVMLALAWALLPERSLERERKGVILVGVARCIAMVLIWCTIAQGDAEYAAILVCLNSLLQIVLFAPASLLFLNILGGSSSPQFKLAYGDVAISVLIFLGIPAAVGFFLRFFLKRILKNQIEKFEKFLDHFDKLALIGLLYTVTVLFALQGHKIVNNIGSLFRIMVPLSLYFFIVWFSTFFALYFHRRYSQSSSFFGGYPSIVVQAFTASSNNFELAIGVAVASFGADSPEILGATVGPLTEVPILLTLAYVSLFLKDRLDWKRDDESGKEGEREKIREREREKDNESRCTSDDVIEEREKET